jgi:uncharacterized protein YkwD
MKITGNTKPKAAHFSALFLSLLCALILQAGCSVSKPKPSNTKSAGHLNALEYQLLDLVNKERKRAGLNLYIMDNALQNVARAHSADMVKRDFFAHKNPDGENPFDRMTKAGINYMKAAENVAYNASVSEIHRSLMNSPGHRKNIMNPALGKIGIGIVPSKYGLMATQVFKNP